MYFRVSLLNKFQQFQKNSAQCPINRTNFLHRTASHRGIVDWETRWPTNEVKARRKKERKRRKDEGRLSFSIPHPSFFVPISSLFVFGLLSSIQFFGTSFSPPLPLFILFLPFHSFKQFPFLFAFPPFSRLFSNPTSSFASPHWPLYNCAENHQSGKKEKLE